MNFVSYYRKYYCKNYARAGLTCPKLITLEKEMDCEIKWVKCLQFLRSL
jgi:hypothetical protein